jgi:hypothetical protein
MIPLFARSKGKSEGILTFRWTRNKRVSTDQVKRAVNELGGYFRETGNFVTFASNDIREWYEANN